MSRINNSFRFTGNLGKDAEIRYNPKNGKPIATFPLFVDSSYRNRETREKVERGDWFDLTVYYEGLVDVVTKYTRKGSQIQVRGNMHKRVWASKDRKDLEGHPLKESRIEFKVTEIMLLGSRPKDEAASDQPQAGNSDWPEAGTTFTAPEDDYDDDIPF